VSSIAAGWVVSDLQFLHFSFRVSQAMQEISAMVEAGQGQSIHAPIKKFVDTVQSQPSLEAAFELVTGLDSD
jgi:hypothetical protein